MISKRKEYIELIRKKEIILFGAGECAVHFYRRFKDDLPMVGCVTNNRNERIFSADGKEIWPIYRVEEIDYSSGKFVIVCAKNYLPMEEQLKTMGMCYGVDYIDSETFEVLCSEKKIALFYGVCYSRAIYTCLQSSREFSLRYHSYYWMEYLKMDALQEELFSYMLEICDFYLYNAFFTPEKRRLNNAYLARLNKHCIIISIPVLVFNGYYPCESDQIGKDNMYNVTSCLSPYAPFLTPDRNINRMIEEKIGLSEILKRVSDEGFYQKDFIIKNYEKEMKKLELAEKIADIKICDFLYENHQKKRTFLNEKHISNIVIMELADRILEKLGLKRDINNSILKERLLYTSEVPVYPSVIKHLSLEIYRGTYTLYTFKGDIQLTFEQYVERYYEYCLMMRSCFKKGYFPCKAE